MSSYVTTSEHPVDKDRRACLAFDDCFGHYQYGHWFVKKKYRLKTLDWDTPSKFMEKVIYHADYENTRKTKPAPKDWDKKAINEYDNQIKQPTYAPPSAYVGDTNVTNIKKDFCVDENTIFWAFRYALGRRTGAVMHMVGIIKKNWQLLQFHTQEQMKEEITKAIFDGRAGDDCDVESWQEILKLKGDSND